MLSKFRAPEQLSLFEAVVQAYADGRPRSNEELYEGLVAAGHLSPEQAQRRDPVGRARAAVNLTKRRIRWWQQDLRSMGVLERLPDQRGTWRLAERNKHDLTVASPGVMMIGCSTDLGVAIWGSCLDVFSGLSESVAVCITSTPYPLCKPRAYGNPSQQDWVDWACRQLEPIVRRLLPGGSIAVNISNDIFVPGSPARSLYKEHFVIAMHARLGMHKMDEVIWSCENKAPAPYQWASRQRMQLNTGYEPVLIFCNDPLASFADNRRVLQPHTDAHRKLMLAGGERRQAVHGDGAYRIKPGSFGRVTEGRIPKNVLRIGNNCAAQRQVKHDARAQGLPHHGATMPLALARFLVQYLSREGDLVVDPFAGSLTTAQACEELGRRWLCSEIVAEYLMGGRLRPGLQRVPQR